MIGDSTVYEPRLTLTHELKDKQRLGISQCNIDLCSTQQVIVGMVPLPKLTQILSRRSKGGSQSAMNCFYANVSLRSAKNRTIPKGIAKHNKLTLSDHETMVTTRRSFIKRRKTRRKNLVLAKANSYIAKIYKGFLTNKT